MELLCCALHSGFFYQQFLFLFESSCVHFTSHKTDLTYEPIDDLAPKPINYLTKSVKKVPLHVKRCELKARMVGYSGAHKNGDIRIFVFNPWGPLGGATNCFLGPPKFEHAAFCSRAMIGKTPENFKKVIPRVCISLALKFNYF